MKVTISPLIILVHTTIPEPLIIVGNKKIVAKTQTTYIHEQEMQVKEDGRGIL